MMIDQDETADSPWLMASFDDPSKSMWSLPEQIASKLIAGIIMGDYQPGQRLHEIALAETFNVSRGPVRDALRLLEREGLVQIEARRGTWVRMLSRKEVRDIFEVRSVLLGLAASEVARNPSPATLEFVDLSCKAMRASIDAGDDETFLTQVYRFSMFLAKNGGNDLARTILFQLGRQTLRLTRRALAGRDHQLTWLTNWTAIADAVRRRDPAAADRATRVLVDTVEQAVLDVFDEEAEAHLHTVTAFEDRRGA